ncbi:hypothetical protein [Aeromonas dhakensis]|uniref:hypothetical protein n=1 Tax=Aeromonas dhakensis TaxID=196024 RepID=UPI003BA02730
MSYFDERDRQVDVESMVSFGVKIESRYAKATELSEMLMFTNQLAIADLHTYVDAVFYDSKACVCNIELKIELTINSNEGDQIKACAEETISQFQWDGEIVHGHAFKKWCEENGV